MEQEETLDPADWEAMRITAHRMVDEAIARLSDVREAPVWQDMPEQVRAAYKETIPLSGQPLDDVFDEIKTNLLPYPMGNIHPRFWMWYMGSSNFTGALGDFLAAILGSNLGGGNHAAALMDRQVGLRSHGTKPLDSKTFGKMDSETRNWPFMRPIRFTVAI